MKRFFCTVISLILLCNFPLYAYATDMSYAKDCNQNEIEVVVLGDQHELVCYNGITIEDITTEQYRKIITQSLNDTSIYYEDLSTGMATLSVNGLIVDTYNMEELRLDYCTWTIPSEDITELEECLSNQISSDRITLPTTLQDKYMVQYSDCGEAIIRPISDCTTYSVRATYEPVRPAEELTDVYPEYIYKEIDSTQRYSSYCGRYLDMSIKDTMHNYVQTSKRSYIYEAYTAVSVIAGALSIQSSSLARILTNYVSLIDGVLQLTKGIEFYFSEKYQFAALRQAYVYDYTRYYRDVSVLTYNGYGEISLTWDYIRNQYTNPSYKITAQAYPQTVAYSGMYDDALEIWEYNMYEYGYWGWGDI